MGKDVNGREGDGGYGERTGRWGLDGAIWGRMSSEWKATRDEEEKMGRCGWLKGDGEGM